MLYQSQWHYETFGRLEFHQNMVSMAWHLPETGWHQAEPLNSNRQEMAKLPASGKARNVGICNFQIINLEKLLNDPSCNLVPAVNQIEASWLEPFSDCWLIIVATSKSPIVSPHNIYKIILPNVSIVPSSLGFVPPKASTLPRTRALDPVIRDFCLAKIKRLWTLR